MVDQEREELIGLALARRAYLYSMFHLVFGSEPAPEALQGIFSTQTREALEFADGLLAQGDLAETGSTQLADTGCTLGEWVRKAAMRVASGTERLGDPAFLEDMKSDYARLLQMPGESYVHPWESPYVGKEGMIFQESTLDVRSFYHEAGFKLAAEKRFPDDHIGAMMDYLGHQALAAYEAFADGDDAAAAQLLSVQRDFLRKHVLSWVDAFAAKMVQNDSHGCYGALAAAMAAFARGDEAWLGAVVEELRA